MLFARWIAGFAGLAAFGVGGVTRAATTEERLQIPRFDSAPCQFTDEAPDWPAVNGVSCGWVTVKAHHEVNDSPTLRLWVVKVAAKNSATRGQTALIRLWYGPMAANITASSLKNAPFTELVRATRDVVFFDYRGMGRSEPDTKCVVAPATGSTIKARLRSVLVQSRECRRQIEARGTDLDALNAATSSQDVRDIARAMNYSSYEVWGASYGSFPALDLIGRHPAGLRAAVVGVAIPPDSRNREQVSTFARGLAAMQRECNREPSCRARFPEMAASLGRAMQRLGRERLMGRSRRLTPVDLYQALLGMAAFAPDPGSLTFVPLAIETAEKGDAALVARWIDATKGDDFGIPDMANPDVAAQTTLYCSALGNRPTKPDYEAAARRYPYLALAATPTDAMDRLCNSWKISGPPRNLWRPVKSDIPVLFYSAALDTAVTNSDTVAAARLLPRSTIITVPGVGHSFSDGCLVQVEAAFLANPYGVLDRSCTANMKPIRFALHGFEAYAAEVAAH